MARATAAPDHVNVIVIIPIPDSLESLLSWGHSESFEDALPANDLKPTGAMPWPRWSGPPSGTNGR
jgi:hypothetical protein